MHYVVILLIALIILSLVLCTSIRKPEERIERENLRMVLPPVNAVQTNAYGYVYDDYTTFPERPKVAHGDNFSKSYL